MYSYGWVFTVLVVCVFMWIGVHDGGGVCLCVNSCGWMVRVMVTVLVRVVNNRNRDGL